MVISVREKNMVKVKRFSAVEMFTLGNGGMEKEQDRAVINFLMAGITKVKFGTVSLTVLAN